MSTATSTRQRSVRIWFDARANNGNGGWTKTTRDGDHVTNEVLPRDVGQFDEKRARSIFKNGER